MSEEQKPTKLDRQIVKAVKAARAAAIETQKLVKELTDVDMHDALKIGEVFKLQAAARYKLKDELEGMTFWSEEADQADHNGE